MRPEEDKNEYREMLENIISEYHIGKPINNDYWNLRYNKVLLNKRFDNWMIIVARYEYMVHGEFKEQSVEDETQLIVRIIKEKDKDSQELLLRLHDELLNRGLQNEEISDYMAKRIKELI